MSAQKSSATFSAIDDYLSLKKNEAAHEGLFATDT